MGTQATDVERNHFWEECRRDLRVYFPMPAAEVLFHTDRLDDVLSVLFRRNPLSLHSIAVQIFLSVILSRDHQAFVCLTRIAWQGIVLQYDEKTLRVSEVLFWKIPIEVTNSPTVFASFELSRRTP